MQGKKKEEEEEEEEEEDNNISRPPLCSFSIMMQRIDCPPGQCDEGRQAGRQAGFFVICFS